MPKANSALLIIDMLNLFNFPEADKLHRRALKITAPILNLKKRFQKRGAPVIYVNDQYQKWKAGWRDIYAETSKAGRLGADIAKKLEPSESDIVLLKPKHSAFFQTPLEEMLKELKIKKVVITGIAGNVCVLFTAHDAHMRELEVIVPRDGIASLDKKTDDFVLKQMKELKFATPLSSSLKI